MKFGYFVALLCASLAVVFASLLYWDLQDGEFSERLLFLTLIPGILAGAFLLFPGGPTKFKDIALSADSQRLVSWVRQAPPWQRKVWLAALGLGVYASLGASQYLQGKPFFTLGTQLLALVILWLGFWLGRSWLQNRLG